MKCFQFQTSLEREVCEEVCEESGFKRPLEVVSNDFLSVCYSIVLHNLVFVSSRQGFFDKDLEVSRNLNS